MISFEEAFSLLMVGLIAAALTAVASAIAQRKPVNRVLDGEAHLQALVETLTSDLAAANRKIGELTAKLGQVQAELVEVKQMLAAYQGDRDNQTLLVGIGTDPQLEIDLSALRGVRGRKGPITIQRLIPVSADSLAHMLQTYRNRGRPIRWLHLATKATPKGIEMADGLCTGTWLSGELSEVKALLLGGCETFEVGEMVANVPLVATTLEKINHKDAMTVAGLFWQAVADELTPPEIEARCRQGLPNRLSEMIDVRWR
jgi:hypothetical protein